ncbi:DUF429 domain-containing protein [Variovorax sp. Sphag1AA]|uniref:DUF429 domain-containing protein n=1 Tax=Variovorax sp. Sphag1AA TaxID=2587027 RepID=UPI001620A1FD|nr:DUF429 domain-containing protein [Variovorax sp. Sphag1AA]MBB3177412.1 hypothetical protein [Variovorax sp. Sphag1AA]
MRLIGCDFSSAPTSRKPIVVALGSSGDGRVELQGFECFASLDDWTCWLAETPQWVGAFDFPFGLPRELCVELGWPLEWRSLMSHYAAIDRPQIRDTFAAFCAARPAGSKFAHRATDRPAGSSPSMKWVNPPVAYMLHAGVPRLIAAGASLPGLHVASEGGGRIALEGYPGLLARELIGRRSYKSDQLAGQTAERRTARDDLLAALERGASRLELRLAVSDDLRERLLADAKGDHIDAALCLVQAAWGAARRTSEGPGYGLPPAIDPLEGWIVTA